MAPKKILLDGIAALDLPVPESAVEPLCRYCDELIKWGRKINLVAKAGVEEILETHFLDSLTLLTVLPIQTDLADIGTGGGFPGLVLKTARPELELTLVEPRQKRVSFLKHIIRTLGLSGVEILAGRLEENSNLVAGTAVTAEYITSRAFTSINEFLSLTAPCSPPGGKVICMKGPKAEEELRIWQQEQPDSPYTLSDIKEFTLPVSKHSRSLATFIKERTP